MTAVFGEMALPSGPSDRLLIRSECFLVWEHTMDAPQVNDPNLSCLLLSHLLLISGSHYEHGDIDRPGHHPVLGLLRVRRELSSG